MIAAHDPLGTGERVAEDEIAIIMFTSGTTGRPKGAMLTHGNIWWNNINVLLAYDVLADDVSLLVAPLFHIGGLNVTNDGADPIDLRGRAAAHYPMLKNSLFGDVRFLGGLGMQRSKNWLGDQPI